MPWSPFEAARQTVSVTAIGLSRVRVFGKCPFKFRRRRLLMAVTVTHEHRHYRKVLLLYVLNTRILFRIGTSFPIQYVASIQKKSEIFRTISSDSV